MIRFKSIISRIISLHVIAITVTSICMPIFPSDFCSSSTGASSSIPLPSPYRRELWWQLRRLCTLAGRM